MDIGKNVKREVELIRGVGQHKHELGTGDKFTADIQLEAVAIVPRILTNLRFRPNRRALRPAGGNDLVNTHKECDLVVISRKLAVTEHQRLEPSPQPGGPRHHWPLSLLPLEKWLVDITFLISQFVVLTISTTRSIIWLGSGVREDSVLSNIDCLFARLRRTFFFSAIPFFSKSFF